VEETEDAYSVEIELPGVRREDIDIQLDDRQLTVSGEVKGKERAGILRRRTRRVGRFQYSVTLPADVDADDVNARLNDGVLTVRVPRPSRPSRGASRSPADPDAGRAGAGVDREALGRRAGSVAGRRRPDAPTRRSTGRTGPGSGRPPVGAGSAEPGGSPRSHSHGGERR